MDIQTKEDCILSFKNKLCFAINNSVSNLDRFREKKTTTALKIESSLSTRSDHYQEKKINSWLIS
jgi:hypothetical protein